MHREISVESNTVSGVVYSAELTSRNERTPINLHEYQNNIINPICNDFIVALNQSEMVQHNQETKRSAKGKQVVPGKSFFKVRKMRMLQRLLNRSQFCNASLCNPNALLDQSSVMASRSIEREQNFSPNTSKLSAQDRETVSEFMKVSRVKKFEFLDKYPPKKKPAQPPTFV